MASSPNPPAEKDSCAPLYGFVLAGGSGKRFWPLSREMSPKQLLSIFGTQSLVADALERLAATPGIATDQRYVLTNERLADELRNTLACSDDELLRRTPVLVEPLGRDTGPAVALCAALAYRHHPQAAFVIMPSNHVASGEIWPEIAGHALAACAAGRLVTVGLPDTSGVDLSSLIGAESADDPLAVAKCVSFPAAIAGSQRPLAASDVLIARADRFLELLDLHPQGAVIRDIAVEVASAAPANWATDSVRELFAEMPPISLTGLLSAACEHLSVVVGGDHWHGIGDFRALDAISAPDSLGNHRLGRGVDVDSTGTIVWAPDRLVATLGVEDLIVVDTSDATLVCSKERASDVRLVADALAAQGVPEATSPKVSLRPWGSWTSLLQAEGYQMKVIVVDPGKRVSLQSHVHRSEHWIVVEGSAAVTLGDEVVDLVAGQSVFIPATVIHRMENTGDVALRIIEVQVGEYLGEDDIVRYADDYDRLT